MRNFDQMEFSVDYFMCSINLDLYDRWCLLVDLAN